MLIDRDNRVAIFRLCIAASDDAAEVFLLRVADRLKMPAPRGDRGPILTLRMSAGTFRDWKVDVDLRTPALPPSGPGWMALALKGDGVLMVAHRPSSDASGRVVNEVKSTLEELGYAWESFPRAGYVLGGVGLDGLFGDAPVFRGDDGVMDAVKGITARMIDSTKLHWPSD